MRRRVVGRVRVIWIRCCGASLGLATSIPGQQMYDDMPRVSMSGCGTTAWTYTPNDVRICNGKMFETVNDGGGVVNLNTYPKQPFDFNGRTGRVTFDVSADSDGSHGAWPEFVITDKPVPGVRPQHLVRCSGGCGELDRLLSRRLHLAALAARPVSGRSS